MMTSAGTITMLKDSPLPKYWQEMTMMLEDVFDGWQGYQISLVNAIKPLAAEQLLWRPATHANSVGEVARHISLGRISWFVRMQAPGADEVAKHVKKWEEDRDGNRHIVESAVTITESAGELVEWLELTWGMIDRTLSSWTVDELDQTYRHIWNGTAYANSRQWTLWRILSHDIHHGGELSLMLGLQGIEAFELSGLFGHIVLPSLAE